MPDGVLVAPAALLDDGLGVVDHEAAEDQQAAPQVQLEKGGAPAKNTRISTGLLLILYFRYEQQCTNQIWGILLLRAVL